MNNGMDTKPPLNLHELDVGEDTRRVQSRGWRLTAQFLNRVATNLFKQLQNVLFIARIFTRLLQPGSRLSKKIKSTTTISALVLAAILAGHGVSAQVAPPSQPLASLKTVSIPEPDNINEYIKDKTAAIALGKTLFWDMQVGSDGIQSCASCHFHAGADNRSKNQINPGLNRVNADKSPNPDRTFNLGGHPNYQLLTRDYPFRPQNNDVTGSQGLFKADFVDIVPGSDKDNVTPQKDDVFNVNGINVRQVTDRNSPTPINAVFNFRNFWDGRAQNIFNGVNPFGLRDPNAFVLKADGLNSLKQVQVKLKNSSLASQAVGPPTSPVEQSSSPLFIELPQEPINFNTPLGEGATVAPQNETLNPLFETEQEKPLTPKKLGKKMLSLTPLGKQLVASDDSVLGSYSAAPAKGLNRSYASLIQTAFKPEWWNSDLIVSFDEQNNGTIVKKPDRPLTTNEVRLIEYNFSLFFGLAVQAYESTLVSDNSPFDQYFDGNSNALTAQQKRGLEVFQNRGKCINCHGGAEFTNASVKNVQGERLEILEAADGGKPVYDNGFYNIGVRPTLDDLGVGGTEPEKIGRKPLSETRLAQLGEGEFQRDLGEKPNISVSADQRVDVDGAFKTPGLRNVELTAPYFHNGGQLTLEQVVDFYARGGDFLSENRANVPRDINDIRENRLNPTEKADLVAFLKALTDDRVRSEKAPFDHPQLFVPNGHPGNQNSVTRDGNSIQATDQLLEIPAVGRNGGQGTPNFLAS